MKKDGLIIIGVSNKVGRLRTNFRQLLYKILKINNFSKKVISTLDLYLCRSLSEEKRKVCFLDQYEHPLERKHSIDEVIDWFESNNISFMDSIPSPHFEFKITSKMDGNKGTSINRLFAQVTMLFTSLGSEEGVCVVVGRKRNNHNLHLPLLTDFYLANCICQRFQYVQTN